MTIDTIISIALLVAMVGCQAGIYIYCRSLSNRTRKLEARVFTPWPELRMDKTFTLTDKMEASMGQAALDALERALETADRYRIGPDGSRSLVDEPPAKTAMNPEG